MSDIKENPAVQKHQPVLEKRKDKYAAIVAIVVSFMLFSCGGMKLDTSSWESLVKTMDKINESNPIVEDPFEQVTAHSNADKHNLKLQIENKKWSLLYKMIRETDESENKKVQDSILKIMKKYDGMTYKKIIDRPVEELITPFLRTTIKDILDNPKNSK